MGTLDVVALAGDAGFVLAAIKVLPGWFAHRTIKRGMADKSAKKIADIAAFLAGRKRRGLREEWCAHLAGEDGKKLTAAAGFVAAAGRYRLTDMGEAAWVPADAVLKSRKLSNLVVLLPTVMAASFILRDEGTLGVVTSAESISAIGGGLYGLIRVGRWWRDVKPPEPKARQARSDGGNE